MNPKATLGTRPLPSAAAIGPPSGHLVIDYPAPGGVLSANVRTITGWAWWPDGSPDHVVLRIDGVPVSSGRTGYPRLDAVDKGVPIESALNAGFRIEFEPGSLPPGIHSFEISFGSDELQRSCFFEASKLPDGGPLHVADVFIDIVGHCNLRCAMCPQGNLEGVATHRPRTVMSVRQLDQILDHLESEGCLTGVVNLYNWGDPLLHPQLDRMLEVCAAHEQRVILSSNLSMPPRHVERLLDGQTDLLMVSLSGMEQGTYQRNHRGGDIKRVLENLACIAERPDAVRSVLMKYLVFDYNRSELEPARAFARAHGIRFGAYRGAIPSLESRLVQIGDREYATTTTQFVRQRSSQSPITGGACPQESNIIVDSEGNLDICAMAWRHQFGASAADADMRAYLIHKMDNATCNTCQAVGYSHYRHYEVMDPELIRVSLPE